MGHWEDRDSYSWFRSWSRLRKFSRTSWDKEAKVIRRKASETNGGSVGTVVKSYKQKDPGIFKLQNTFESAYEPVASADTSVAVGPEYLGTRYNTQINGGTITMDFTDLGPQAGDIAMVVLGHGWYSSYTLGSWTGWTRLHYLIGNDTYDHNHYVFYKTIGAGETTLTTPSTIPGGSYPSYSAVAARLFLFRNVSTVDLTYYNNASNTAIPVAPGSVTLLSNTGFLMGSGATGYYSANITYTDTSATNSVVSGSSLLQIENDTRDICMRSFLHPIDNTSFQSGSFSASTSTSYDSTSIWAHVY